MHRVELRHPSLFGVGIGALTRLLNCLLVCMREVTQLLQLGLKPGANAVDDPAKLFLGHLFALSEAQAV
jgi:hypothetical protein